MCSHFQLPPVHKIEKYLKEDLNLPLVPVDFPKEEFKDATEIFPKRKSLVLLYQDDKLQLQIMDWGYPSPFKPNQCLIMQESNAFLNHSDQCGINPLLVKDALF